MSPKSNQSIQGVELQLTTNRGTTTPGAPAKMLRQDAELTYELGWYPNLGQSATRAGITTPAAFKRRARLCEDRILLREKGRIRYINPVALLDPPEALAVISLAGVIEGGRFIDGRIGPIAPDRILKLPTAQAFRLDETDVQKNLTSLQQLGIIHGQDDGVELDRRIWQEKKLIFLEFARSPVQDFDCVRKDYCGDAGKLEKRPGCDLSDPDSVSAANKALKWLVEGSNVTGFLHRREIIVEDLGLGRDDLDRFVASLSAEAKQFIKRLLDSSLDDIKLEDAPRGLDTKALNKLGKLLTAVDHRVEFLSIVALVMKEAKK